MKAFQTLCGHAGVHARARARLHFPSRTTNVIASASAMCNVLSVGVWPVCVNFKWMSVSRDFQCIIALLQHDRVGSAVRGVSVASDWQINVSTPRWWAQLGIATCLFEMMHNTMDNGQLVANYQVELSLCCNHRQETGSKLLSLCSRPVFACPCTTTCLLWRTVLWEGNVTRRTIYRQIPIYCSEVSSLSRLIQKWVLWYCD